MKIVSNSENCDFAERMYVFVGDWGYVAVLKHFTLVTEDRRQISKWRWITLDGRIISNILITSPLGESCMMYNTPSDAFEARTKQQGCIYEFKSIAHMLNNWDKSVLEEDK